MLFPVDMSGVTISASSLLHSSTRTSQFFVLRISESSISYCGRGIDFKNLFTSSDVFTNPADCNASMSVDGLSVTISSTACDAFQATSRQVDGRSSQVILLTIAIHFAMKFSSVISTSPL